MRLLLTLTLALISLAANGQGMWRNFFTTNQSPAVDVVAGSNVTVQASTPNAQTRRFTVNAIPDGVGIDTSTATNISAYQAQIATNNPTGGILTSNLTANGTVSAKTLIVDQTNIVSSAGSSINGVSMTNSAVGSGQLNNPALPGLFNKSERNTGLYFAVSAQMELSLLGSRYFSFNKNGLDTAAASSIWGIGPSLSSWPVLIFRNSSLSYSTNVNAGGTLAVTNSIIANSGVLLKGLSAEPTAVPGHGQIYSATNTGVTEVFVQGDDGTETQVSAHPADAPAELYDASKFELEQNILREVNPFITNGVVRWVNMTRMARMTELNTRALLYLAGNANAITSNALQRIKDMTPAHRQVIATETFAEYNQRTGGNLKPLVWEVVEAQRQSDYDAERARLAQEAEWLTQTNTILTAQGSTNLVLVPEVPPAKDIRRPKPTWMKQ